uniref:TRASH domain-containing protein n=1 Tax=Periophthalmus magnuspinnatus TaxID=409849 RepID=A0A3B4BJ72_9GOBI
DPPDPTSMCFCPPRPRERTANLSNRGLHRLCKKALVKGQTAFQRKGCPSVYCSTSCLTANLKKTDRICHQCRKSVQLNVHSVKNFCSQKCLFTFKKLPKPRPSTSASAETLCSIKHEVSLCGILHKLCSDDCFETFRTTNKLTMSGCVQCGSFFSTKPLLLILSDGNKTLCNQDCLSKYKEVSLSEGEAQEIQMFKLFKNMVFFCGQNCLLDFKTSNFLFNVCDYCKVEKVTKEVKRIMSKTCNFCSDGCKLLYRHDLTKSWGKHCHSCSFCHSVSKKVLTAHYGTAEEQFCSELCRSNYTMLFCHVAKCDFCGRKGKLKQSLSLLGDAKHFCDLNCLLQFCIKTTQEQGTATSAPAPPTKILKNKALLCKPLVQNKGISCKTQTTDSGIQTDKCKPDILILPVPVPVYVPVPMAMYSQCTPHPLGLPVPLPVPMFLPVAMDNAEKIVETIQEIKQKIPPDPFEAELILMAEMVAEDTEEKPKEKPPERRTSRTNAPAHDGIFVDFNFILYLRMIVMFFHLFFYFKGRKPKRYAKSPEPEVPSAPLHTELTLKSEYGLNAWKHWVQWRRNQPQLQKLRIGSRPFELREDVLQCTTAELSLCLCFFISEIKRPNGESYSPDSLYSLASFRRCYFLRFSADFTTMLGDFKPIITSSYVHSRVEESFMWECKQLGAYSPIVLLNTLLFFCCKHFGFRTVAQHRQLSFAHVMRCTKTDPSNNKTTFLRFYPPVQAGDTTTIRSFLSTTIVLEMPENAENPLRCPVRLYEFYLSKCSESVKQRTNLFYLLPERCCVPNSPLWFSSTPLDDATMESMLVRILSMRELHPKFSSNHGNNNFDALDDKPYLPEEDSD